jgi:hypothetical protein
MAARRGGLGLAALAAIACAPAAARAGPPYITDDPEPTDTGHWEVYDFATGIGVPGDLTGEGGLDINYGGAKNLQLTAVIPASFENANRFGGGDIELAVKYRFLTQQDGGWTPDVAFFPRVFLATGTRFDPERPGLFLPIWAEKDWGPWSLFGGGGPQLNPGAGERNFWQTGLALSRALGDRWSVGAEVFHQTAETVSGKNWSAVNLGATYKLSSHWTLMGSAGPGVENAREEGQYDFYAALLATY